MAGARQFQIRKGSGGLLGRAMSTNQQMSGNNNEASFAFQRSGGGGTGGLGDSFLLKEDGGFLLQENGALIIL